MVRVSGVRQSLEEHSEMVVTKIHMAFSGTHLDVDVLPVELERTPRT